MGNNKTETPKKGLYYTEPPPPPPKEKYFILVAHDGTRKSLNSSIPVILLRNTMKATESVKNLCVNLDAENSMQRHVANLCCVCYCHL